MKWISSREEWPENRRAIWPALCALLYNAEFRWMLARFPESAGGAFSKGRTLDLIRGWPFSAGIFLPSFSFRGCRNIGPLAFSSGRNRGLVARDSLFRPFFPVWPRFLFSAGPAAGSSVLKGLYFKSCVAIGKNNKRLQTMVFAFVFFEFSLDSGLGSTPLTCHEWQFSHFAITFWSSLYC